MRTFFEESGEYRAAASLRRCARCGELKPLEAFRIKNKERGTRVSYCDPCRLLYGREHYDLNRNSYVARSHAWKKRERPLIRAHIDDYLRSHPCIDCGCADLAVLDFDHRDRLEKRLEVSRLARGWSWQNVLREIEKCDVRCANCHRLRTAAQLKWTRALGVVKTGGTLRAGSYGRYARVDVPVQGELFAGSDDGLKHCSRCGERKSLPDFGLTEFPAGRRQYVCKACRSAYRRAHYEKNRADYLRRSSIQVRQKREDVSQMLHEYLRSHPCVDCGERSIVMLEFDHIDPDAKTTDVSTITGHRPWQKVLAEIGKCEVRCANCHRRRTAKQQGWKNRLGEHPALYVYN